MYKKHAPGFTARAISYVLIAVTLLMSIAGYPITDIWMVSSEPVSTLPQSHVVAACVYLFLGVIGAYLVSENFRIAKVARKAIGQESPLPDYAIASAALGWFGLLSIVVIVTPIGFNILLMFRI